MSREQDTVSKIIHKIRNIFGPIETFLDIVDTANLDSKVKDLHQNCKENLKELLDLLQKTRI